MVSTESKRFYPTPSTTKYFIRGIEIDDVYRVDFRRVINHQPMYGYDSSRFGFVARGKELVTGNIIINYRYPGYLRNVIQLQSSDDIVSSNKIDENFYKKSYNPTLDAEQTIEDMGMQNSDSDKMNIIANRLMEMYQRQNASSDADILNKFKKVFEKKFAVIERDDPKITAIRSPLDDDFEITMFDLSVQYGFSNVAQFPYTRTFKNCVLTGESETVSASAGVGNDMSSSAQPILEVYPFFARTIITTKGQG